MSWVLSRYGLDREAVLRHPSTFFTPIQPSGLSIPAPAAFWRMEQTSGDETDEVGGLVLTDTNTVTSAVGKVGNARQFTAANSEYLVAADHATLSMGSGVSFTLAAWIYPDTVTSSRTIFCKGVTDTTEDFRFSMESGNLTLRIYDGTTAFDHAPARAPTVTAWNLVVAWFDDAANTLNIQLNDGVVASLTSVTGFSRDSAGGFRLGANTRTGGDLWPWNGRIDAAAVWKTVLTAGERTALYNGGAGAEYYSGSWHG
jgi:hypothetical protein